MELADDSIHVSLLCAKHRVILSKRISTPQSELNGAVFATRLALSYVNNLTNAGTSIDRLWLLEIQNVSLLVWKRLIVHSGSIWVIV